jgi:hypothetical protein
MSYIDQYGKYHRGEAPATIRTSSQYKAWDHDRQRADHRLDLLQPWKNGKLSSEFKEMYPEEAKNYE